eukprot:204350-Chlamydomonas_euryale.AAC.1
MAASTGAGFFGGRGGRGGGFEQSQSYSLGVRECPLLFPQPPPSQRPSECRPLPRAPLLVKLSWSRHGPAAGPSRTL